MNYETLKKEELESKARLVGVTVTPTMVDNELRALELRDAVGTVLRIERQEYGGLRVAVPVRPKVKRWKAKGTHDKLGLIERTYDTEDAAIDAKGVLAEMGCTGVDWDPVEVEVR